MPDLEKAIQWLEIERECVGRDCDRDCGQCDLAQDRETLLSACDDAIALLEAQQPRMVKKMKNVGSHLLGTCPSCEKILMVEEHPKFCGRCGQAVKWE